MMNKVLLIGRLTKNPELRNTQSGKSVVSVSFATNKRWNDEAGNKQEKSEFHNLVIWGKQAEVFTQYTSKGSKLYIEGELATRKWTDKNGIDRYTTEIVVNNFIFLDSANKKTDEEKQIEEQFGGEIIEGDDEIKIEDIPF